MKQSRMSSRPVGSLMISGVFLHHPHKFLLEEAVFLGGLVLALLLRAERKRERSIATPATIKSTASN
ncbi:hypothetical protein ACFQV2_39130 [Actinokineospora soli]|uniref:Uncharacterized protein n=1 Tax=Actinokineospora soli TaxID=1048753 RepID=A0ABW2TX48_9PSEU